MLESSKFLVAGADLHLWVDKAREELFILFSFPRGFRARGDMQMMEGRAAVPPSGPVPVLVAAEPGTRPPAETGTSSAAGRESASAGERTGTACSRSLRCNQEITVLQLPLGNACAACNAKPPAWQQGVRTASFERAVTRFRQTGKHGTHGRAGTGHSLVLK